jgi:hypothetical protein
MKTTTVLILKLFAAMLIACTAPIQTPPATRPAATLPPPKPTVTKPPATSDAPLGSSALLVAWDNRRNQHELRPIDLRQGLPLAGYEPIYLGRNYQYQFSPDEKTLAVVAYPSDTHTRDGVLHLIDVSAWRDVTTPLKLAGWIGAMAFSPDGTHLATAYFDQTVPIGSNGNRLIVIDLATQAIVAQATPDFWPRVLAFSADGGSLIAYGTRSETGNGLNPAAQVTLLDAVDLGVEWDMPLPDIRDGQFQVKASDEPDAWVWWTPAVVLAHDRQTLHIVHADEDKLTTVDVARHTATSVEIAPARSWLEQLLSLGAGVAHAKVMDGTRKQAALSTDGSRLYVVGQTGQSSQDADGRWQFTQSPLDLQVVDVTSGLEIAAVPTQATEIGLSPDPHRFGTRAGGARLYLRGYDSIGVPWTDVLDATSLEVVAHLDGHYVIPAQAQDGQPILLSSDSHTGNTALAALDAQSLDAIHAWTVVQYAAWITPFWNPSWP